MSAEVKSWLAPINSRLDALKVVNDSSAAFFVLAAIQGGIGLFLSVALLFDAAIYATGAFFLRRYNSRVAGSVLFLAALITASSTVGNRLGMEIGGGENVFLALIALVAGVKAVEATWKLHGRFAEGLHEGRSAVEDVEQKSAIRRLLVIGCYLSALTVAAMLATVLISDPCLSADVCTDVDDLISGAVVVGWIAGAISTAVLVWRGYLFGARARVPRVSGRFVVHSTTAE